MKALIHKMHVRYETKPGPNAGWVGRSICARASLDAWRGDFFGAIGITGQQVCRLRTYCDVDTCHMGAKGARVLPANVIDKGAGRLIQRGFGMGLRPGVSAIATLTGLS